MKIKYEKQGDYLIPNLKNKEAKNTNIGKYGLLRLNSLKENKKHKGIYGLYLYYCYLLKVFPTEQPKQYLPYAIRKDIKKLDTISEETKFMKNNKIETIEELLSVKELNNSKLDELVGNREYMWVKYHRAKTESKKIEIYNDISKIQEEIKECRKIKKYVKILKHVHIL